MTPFTYRFFLEYREKIPVAIINVLIQQEVTLWLPFMQTLGDVNPAVSPNGQLRTNNTNQDHRPTLNNEEFKKLFVAVEESVFRDMERDFAFVLETKLKATPQDQCLEEAEPCHVDANVDDELALDAGRVSAHGDSAEDACGHSPVVGHSDNSAAIGDSTSTTSNSKSTVDSIPGVIIATTGPNIVTSSTQAAGPCGDSPPAVNVSGTPDDHGKDDEDDDCPEADTTQSTLFGDSHQDADGEELPVDAHGTHDEVEDSGACEDKGGSPSQLDDADKYESAELRCRDKGKGKERAVDDQRESAGGSLQGPTVPRSVESLRYQRQKIKNFALVTLYKLPRMSTPWVISISSATKCNGIIRSLNLNQTSNRTPRNSSISLRARPDVAFPRSPNSSTKASSFHMTNRRKILLWITFPVSTKVRKIIRELDLRKSKVTLVTLQR